MAVYELEIFWFLQDTQTLTLLFAKPVEEPTGIIRRSHGRCPLKNLFLKISQYSYEKTFLSLFFNKVAGLNAVKESMNFFNPSVPMVQNFPKCFTN